MKNNPWYDESLPYGHVDPNASLHAQESHWYQQQEDQRLFQLNQAAHGGDFARLQNTAQQFAPQPHHHQGDIPWGGLAAGAIAGYYLANRTQQQQPEPEVTRPEGWKSNILWLYLVVAAVFHAFIGVQFLVADQPVGFWIVGFVIWIPAWIVGILHQLNVSEHNRRLSGSQQS